MEDLDRDELKELVQKNLALTQDTNRIVHTIRRSARLRAVWGVVWWVAIVVLSGAAYYLYLEPYVAKVEQIYGQVQTGNKQVAGWEQQAAEFFKKLLPQQGTTTQRTTASP